jgi:pyruvate decarboxylase
MVPVSSLDATLIKMTLPAGTEDDRALAAIMAALEASKNPIVIVDGGAGRGSWAPHATDLIKALKSLHFNTVMGKGVVGEDEPLFAGCYAGVGSLPLTSKAVEQSDCILWLGHMPADFNTSVLKRQRLYYCVVLIQASAECSRITSSLLLSLTFSGFISQ